MTGNAAGGNGAGVADVDHVEGIHEDCHRVFRCSPCQMKRKRAEDLIVVSIAGYSINSILYQRGIYPPESFSASEKYGLRMVIAIGSPLPPT